MSCDIAVLREKISARQRGGQMIQVAVQNKYSFDMQVSVRAMAVTGGCHRLRNDPKTPDFEANRQTSVPAVHINVF
jgi:hypothetical protein